MSSKELHDATIVMETKTVMDTEFFKRQGIDKT